MPQNFTGYSDGVWAVALARTVTFSPVAVTNRCEAMDARSNQYLRTLQRHTGWIWSVAFSPDGQTLASASDDQTMLWDVSTGQCLRTLQGHRNGVWRRLSPQGTTLPVAQTEP